MKSDIEISRETKKENSVKVAKKLGITSRYLECYGREKAKINLNILKKVKNNPNGKLVPVGTYRFFKDDDGLSINVEWPYGNKYGARKRSAKNKLLPDMHDAK